MNSMIGWGVATVAAMLTGTAFLVLVHLLCRRAERAARPPRVFVPSAPSRKPSSGWVAQAYSDLEAWRHARRASAPEEGEPRE